MNTLERPEVTEFLAPTGDLRLAPGARTRELERALAAGNVVAVAELVGTCER
jgi:hypothetical protein